MDKDQNDGPPILPLEVREEYRRKLLSVWEHTQAVRAAAVKLSTRLIDNAETENDLELARRLLQRCSKHDLSKFQYHVDGISAMNDAQVAEMVCDWYARQSEMGTDFRSFIRKDAPNRWGFTTKSKIYKTIKRFVDLLLDPIFK